MGAVAPIPTDNGNRRSAIELPTKNCWPTKEADQQVYNG